MSSVLTAYNIIYMKLMSRKKLIWASAKYDWISAWYTWKIQCYIKSYYGWCIYNRRGNVGAQRSNMPQPVLVVSSAWLTVSAYLWNVPKTLLSGAKNRFVNNSWWSFKIVLPVTFEKWVAIIHIYKTNPSFLHKSNDAKSQISTYPVLVCALVSPMVFLKCIVKHACVYLFSFTFLFPVSIFKSIMSMLGSRSAN